MYVTDPHFDPSTAGIPSRARIWIVRLPSGTDGALPDIVVEYLETYHAIPHGLYPLLEFLVEEYNEQALGYLAQSARILELTAEYDSEMATHGVSPVSISLAGQLQDARKMQARILEVIGKLSAEIVDRTKDDVATYAKQKKRDKDARLLIDALRVYKETIPSTVGSNVRDAVERFRSASRTRPVEIAGWEAARDLEKKRRGLLPGDDRASSPSPFGGTSDDPFGDLVPEPGGLGWLGKVGLGNFGRSRNGAHAGIIGPSGGDGSGSGDSGRGFGDRPSDFGIDSPASDGDTPVSTDAGSGGRAPQGATIRRARHLRTGE